MPDSGIYTIDGSDVNSRIDWRHELPTTSLTASRLEGFPGYGGVFAILGEITGARVAIEGWLEASSFSGLHAAVRAAERIRDEGALHTVAIHGVDYDNCILQALTVLSRTVGFLHSSGNRWLRVRVRYDWVQAIPEEVV